MIHSPTFDIFRQRWKLPRVVPLVVASFCVDPGSLNEVDRCDCVRTAAKSEFRDSDVTDKELLWVEKYVGWNNTLTMHKIPQRWSAGFFLVFDHPL